MRSLTWRGRCVGVGTGRIRRLLHRPSLAQKISLIFAVFFFISAIRRLIDADIYDPYHYAEFVIPLLLLTLALFDNFLIRFLQAGSLLVLGLLLIHTNANPSDISSFVLISVALAAAYKMRLFGRHVRTAFLVIVGVTVVLSVVSGRMHGFSPMQRVNIVNFILAYMALQYVIFEEETISLTKERDTLSRHANELRPFATLGTNTAGLVHDFKGDVAGLYALASIERLSDNAEIADRIQTYAGRLNTRVEAILDIATAADRVEPEEINVAELLRNVVYYFVEINRDLKHKVTISLDAPDALYYTGRRNALMVILENVIKNSIEATEGIAARAVTIEATPVSDDAGSETLEITVRHNGRHLPPEALDRDALDVRRSTYFRRGKSTKPGGTGLGMLNTIRALEILDATMVMKNLPTGGVESRISLAGNKTKR
ncbi:MAG: sensor histidine kinase [Spirochaetaceae bacterium]|nr:MAG: sensor histidine kinase [Spirochaetaceae bacterium]